MDDSTISTLSSPPTDIPDVEDTRIEDSEPSEASTPALSSLSLPLSCYGWLNLLSLLRLGPISRISARWES
jgi:hypothetical protein